MTDRELLELAAKAAGYTLRDHYEGYPPIAEEINAAWNPLAHDGDALRLAVNLGERYPCAVIGVFNRAAFPHASASVLHKDGNETYVEQDVEVDLTAATRRAIVRAAAEIGKGMETK